MTTTKETLSGVIAPLLTPFDAAGAVDTDRFVEHARRLLEQGCTGLAAFGTTGEATSLGLDERLGLLDALVEGGIAPGQLLPGTGCCSLPDTAVLTSHAVDRGCAGVLLLPPFYYKGVSDDGLFSYVARLIDMVGDERLRIYLYHIPPQAVIGYSVELVGRLGAAFPGVVVGLKDSSGDWDNTAALLRACPGLAIFSGSESALLANLRSGGAGCITATANVNAAAIRALFDHYRDPDADQRQAAITATRELIQSQPLIPMLKAIMAQRSGETGWNRVRPPLAALDAEACVGVLDALAEAA